MQDQEKDTPLVDSAIWPDQAVERLHDIAISTERQIISAAETQGGLSALADHLGMSTAEVSDLVEQTRKSIGATKGGPIDTSNYGTGVLDPEDKSQS